jgi:dephospho-CoA kinase
MVVIGVSGLPGAGKGVVSRIAESMGFKIIRMGDVIREEARKRGEDPGVTAVRLRDEYGKYVVAEKCVERIQESDAGMFLIEGIRSPHEVEIFRKSFPGFRVISVFSTRKTRFRRLRKRQREDDSERYDEFVERDERELGFGIGDVIATSDYMIINEGPIWKIKKQARKILRKLAEKDEQRRINDG